MPYLGKSPQHGNYSKLDDFSGDFDGSDATHAIASNGTAITPVRPEALIISINGVIQEPVTDYTVSGTNITFTTAPTAGDNFFGVAMGEQLQIGTPSDGTITSAKLSSAVLTGHTDIGGAIADADLFLVDDGAGGTLRKTAASRLKTYAGTTIANNTDNYVTTATGTGLNGEANLTFDGSTLTVTGALDVTTDITGLTLNADGDTSAGDNAAIGYTAAEGLILTGQGSTDDITIKNDADTTVVNVATGSTDIEVSAGDLFFGTAGKGVVLGATTNTDANTLDDYEEGTFTPTLLGASSNPVISSGSFSGTYRKIGDAVTIWIYGGFGLSNVGSGTISIGAIPFTSNDGGGGLGGFNGTFSGRGFSASGTTTIVVPRLNPGDTNMTLRLFDQDDYPNSESTSTHSNLSTSANSANWVISCFYFTS